MASLTTVRVNHANTINAHSYVNLEFGMKRYDHNESKRYSYINMNLESNLDTAPRISPALISPEEVHLSSVSPPLPTQHHDESISQLPTDICPTSSLPINIRERSKSSAIRKATKSSENPRPSRTQSYPDSDLADAILAAEAAAEARKSSITIHNQGQSPNKVQSPPVSGKRRKTSVQLSDTAGSDKTTSYQHALQMEETHLSQAVEVSTSRKRLSAVREEGTLHLRIYVFSLLYRTFFNII